jgi:hypothetical protein
MIEIKIRLRLAGNDGDSYDIVSHALHSGVLQDAIKRVRIVGKRSARVVAAVAVIEDQKASVSRSRRKAR